MRCPNCNKFVSYDEPYCEVNSVDVDGDSVRACVTVQLNCAECGDTLKDAEIETEAEIEHTCPDDAKPEEGWTDGQDQFEVENESDADGSSRMETKDRHGKTIKNSRYMRSFYGFTIEPEIKCLKCGETFSVYLSGEEQASAFNECV